MAGMIQFGDWHRVDELKPEAVALGITEAQIARIESAALDDGGATVAHQKLTMLIQQWRLKAAAAPKPAPESVSAPAIAVEAAPVPPEPTRKAGVRRNRGRTQRYVPQYDGDLIYPFFPVPLVPGRIRGEQRRQALLQIEQLRAAMPHPAMLVYLSGCADCDRRFVFTMSAPEARRARGLKPTGDYGDVYLKLLVDATMIEQVSSGGVMNGERVASAYRILPWTPEMQQRALRAFDGFRAAKKAGDPSRGRNPEHARARELA